jgi:hypothetical protein
MAFRARNCYSTSKLGENMKFSTLAILGVFGILGGTLVQASAWACPQLAGNYTCHDHHGDYDMTVTEQTVGGATEYKFDSHSEGSDMDIVTDGQSHAMPDTDSLHSAKYTASCSGTHLAADVTGTLINNETQQSWGSLSEHYDISLDSAQGLLMEGTGKIITSQGQFSSNDEKMNCEHK